MCPLIFLFCSLSFSDKISFIISFTSWTCFAFARHSCWKKSIAVVNTSIFRQVLWYTCPLARVVCGYAFNFHDFHGFSFFNWIQFILHIIWRNPKRQRLYEVLYIKFNCIFGILFWCITLWIIKIFCIIQNLFFTCSVSKKKVLARITQVCIGTRTPVTCRAWRYRLAVVHTKPRPVLRYLSRLAGIS